MADPFVAEIRIFPFSFAPTGWARCDGQLLPISQNTALFSLLQTTYGGDGRTTFALPDMQGNAPMFYGQGNGLSLRDIGQTGGEQVVTLLEAEMPQHTHALQAGQDAADQQVPAASSAIGHSQPFIYRQPTGANSPQAMASQAVAPTGGNQPHNNMQPYLTLSFCIALQGVFPPRTP